MQTAALGALRQYQTVQKATAVTPVKAAPAKPENGIAKGAQEFSQVFENVEKATQAHAVGQADAHSVVEAMASAEMALETAVTVRNRVVEAYQELLRMPV